LKYLYENYLKIDSTTDISMVSKKILSIVVYYDCD